MLLHLETWGEPPARPVVCVHGITGHGKRFRRLAEERLAGRFRVLAPDLRGHGFSDWEPPWSIEALAADVVETAQAAGVERAAWVGHSFGGRLVLEIAARRPELVERMALLDPALELLPHVAFDQAEAARTERTYASAEEAVESRVGDGWGTPQTFVEEDVGEHLVASRDGRFRYRYCSAAVVSLLGALAMRPPEPARVPTLLVHAPRFGLVREEQVGALRAALGPLLEEVEVPGGHMVIWDAYEETADALERFLGMRSATDGPLTAPSAADAPGAATSVAAPRTHP